jgi:polysaccharide export outer membrane protein
VKQLFDGDSAANILLATGDEVRVPAAEKIFVLGNVKKPGAFPYEDSEQMTVRTVLALAEGVLPYTGRTAYVYRKHKDKPEEIPVELRNILSRKAPDVQLRAGDVLYIPDNNGRRFTVSMLERLATFGTGTTSGMLIWRR